MPALQTGRTPGCPWTTRRISPRRHELFSENMLTNERSHVHKHTRAEIYMKAAAR